MPTEVTFEQVREKLEAGGQALEVLPATEYEDEHLAGAVSLPLRKLNAKSVESLDKDRPTIVYCADYQCDLSPRAAVRLESLGFTQVFDYAGGKADWLANGLPTEGENGNAPRIGALVRRDLVVCDVRDRASEVAKLIRDEGQEEAVVVYDGNVVMGRVRLEALGGNEEGAVEAVMEEGPHTFRPSVPLAEMLAYMEKNGMDTALVTTNFGVLVGYFHKGDAESLQAGRAEAADPVHAS